MITTVKFVLGIITVSLSLIAAREFMKSSEMGGRVGGLSSAISWQLWGESVIGAGTLIFATAAHFGWLPHWSIETQSLLRFAMFLATSLTTLHLCVVIRKLKVGK